MADYRYLIVGGGMAADAAIAGIREVDENGTIGILGAEPDPPYRRPMLSKGLWRGKPLEAVWLPAGQRPDVTLHLGCTAERLDLAAKEVLDAAGERYGFDKLLIATGGTPRRLPFDKKQQVIYFRTLQDFRRLQEMSGEGRRLTVIGGGFIGSELAAALSEAGNRVTLLFPGRGICDRLFPADLTAHLNDYYRERGVEVLPAHRATGLDEAGRTLTVEGPEGEKSLSVQGVIAGIGITPNTALAESAGLRVEDGIVVDETLRAGHPDVYAAGDVAASRVEALDAVVRVEHEENASTMGRQAGHAMAGAQVTWDHLSAFYSDLFDLGYEAVGELDPDLEVVTDWQEPFRKGVIYYTRRGRVRGVLLWNVWGVVEEARALIREARRFTPEDLRGRLGS